MCSQPAGRGDCSCSEHYREAQRRLQRAKAEGSRRKGEHHGCGAAGHALTATGRPRGKGMDVPQHDLLLLKILTFVTLAAAAATPVLGQGVLGQGASGQDVAPAVGPAGADGIQGTASSTDFSGIWAHLTWPDFEPPLTGPGPVMNRSHRNGVSDAYELVGDYTNPILKPQAAEVVRRHGEISLTRVPYPTPSNQCWPGGVPFVLFNIGMQMLQQPGKITILYSNNHEVRHVRMNQSHPAHVTPSWYGDSVGHYEGGTLVIDTVGIKIGPFAMVDMYGTPHTDALHVVERYRLVDYDDAREAFARNDKENFYVRQDSFDPNYRGQVLQLRFDVEDPGVF